MKEKQKNLEDEVLNERTKFDQVIKRNLLIDELNKDMMEMNIEDLCKFINQSLYECVHTIRRTNIKQIIKMGDKVSDTLKEQGLTEVSDAIEVIMKDFEFMHEKEEVEKPKDGKEIRFIFRWVKGWREKEKGKAKNSIEERTSSSV